MEHFNLPARTKVGRVVPKNAFEKYTNTKQQKFFTDKILRITWTHKLSPETINLEGEDVPEIQIFKIELKEFTKIPKVLEIIEKAIPYTIIFSVEHGENIYFSTTAKHNHPVKEDTAVLDWTFATGWYKKASVFSYQLNLKKSLDEVYKDFCLQISGKTELQGEQLDAIVEKEQVISALEKEIEKLESMIRKSKQFNKKVELNLRLQKVMKELKRIRKKGF